MRRNIKVAVLTLLLITGALTAASLKPGAPLEYRSEVVLDLSVAQSWQRLQDLSLAHYYVPGIVRTQITTAAHRGVGASRRVYSSDTEYINETVVAWHEQQGFDLALLRDDGTAPAPFKDARFTYKLRGSEEDKTLLGTKLTVVMRGGALGEWAASTLLAGVFQERIDAVAESLKRFYEAAEQVAN